MKYCLASVGTLLLVATSFDVGLCQPPGGGKQPAKTDLAWTLEEALGQLRLNPSDPYLQYVALQLARR